jgi:inorganic pyrophosphatase
MSTSEKREEIRNLMGLLFKSHPWHGVAIGDRAPEILTVYIEIVPTDTVKYELDKATGHLKIDRPQRFSNTVPCLYGFVPRTYCGKKVGQLCMERTGREGIIGDGDPLDICVLSEKAISHGDLLLQAVPIGGLRLIDRNEADDKIIAVLLEDAAFGKWREISECPQSLIERLKHYFLTYKRAPDSADNVVEITDVFGVEDAHECIRRAQEDYFDRFGDVEGRMQAALQD